MNIAFKKVWYDQAVDTGTQPPESLPTHASTGTLHGSTPKRYTTCLRPSSSSSTGYLSNFIGAKYSELLAAIEAMSKLPPEDKFHLDGETARKSFVLLNALEFRQAPAPQLFPQDGEVLNLVWDLGAVRKFLSVAEDEFSELDLHRASLMRCEQDLPEFGTPEWNEWLTDFAGQPRSSTEQI